mmetsp:Transcript_20015/g.41825  ORF Transcript_20015/g.41825 Transcript_20015/m.41825 type:complete len:145 (-) Transcript_20015:953-1387(-)
MYPADASRGDKRTLHMQPPNPRLSFQGKTMVKIFETVAAERHLTVAADLSSGDSRLTIDPKTLVAYQAILNRRGSFWTALQKQVTDLDLEFQTESLSSDTIDMSIFPPYNSATLKVSSLQSVQDLPLLLTCFQLLEKVTIYGYW